MSCPQIGSLITSTANQKAAQNNYRALGCQNLYFLNFVACKLNSCHGNYSRGETIQGRKLFAEIRRSLLKTSIHWCTMHKKLSIFLIVGANSFPVRENLMSITELRKQNKSYAHSSIHIKINENYPEWWIQKQQKRKISFEFFYIPGIKCVVLVVVYS